MLSNIYHRHYHYNYYLYYLQLLHHNRSYLQHLLSSLSWQVRSVETTGAADENSVIEVDFYYAQTLLCQDEETILRQALTALNTADPDTFTALKRENVEDFAVIRVPKGINTAHQLHTACSIIPHNHAS